MLHQNSWTNYLIPGLIIVLLTSHIYYLSRNFLLVGALLGVSFFALALQGFFERSRPPNRFHILQPWRIPDPTTRVTLWSLAGFDALLYMPVYITFVLSLAAMADLDAVFIVLAFTSMLVLTMLGRYWRMRRQYEPVPSRDGEGGRDGCLSYVGPSDLSRRERTTIAIVATAVFIVGWIFTPLLWILWISRA